MSTSCTIEEVADHAGVSLDALRNTDCTDKDLLVFSPLLGDSWYLIGTSLISNDQLSAIEGTVEEKRVAVLQQWKQSCLNATYQVLVEALLARHMARQAVEVCEQLKKSHPTGRFGAIQLHKLTVHVSILKGKAGLLSFGAIF